MNERPMYETAAALIEAEIRDQVKGMTAAEDVLGVAFKAAKDHWMFTREEDQFKGALGAALITLKDTPEGERLNDSIRGLGRANAFLQTMMTGGTPNWDELKAMNDTNEKLIPLRQMWADAKDPAAAHQRNLGKTLGITS